MVSNVIAGFGFFAATYAFLRFLLSYTQDVNKPKPLATFLPFLSPLLGMAKKSKFYTDLRDQHRLPIYTLRLLGSQLYIVNDTNLIPAVQRQTRFLDSAPVEARAGINVMAATKAGQEILNLEREGLGKHAYAIEFDKAIHHAVTPGAHLDAMNRKAVQRVFEFVETLALEQTQNIRLYDWVHTSIARATTDAVYGPENPFKYGRVLDAFGKFENGIVPLLIGLPSMFAKEATLCKLDEKGMITIDITEVKHACPLLLSTLQEVLRFHGIGASVRIVQEDHVLDGKYLLKKGGTLMIPGPVQHSERNIYGDSVDDFDHKRFIRSNTKRLNPWVSVDLVAAPPCAPDNTLQAPKSSPSLP